MRAAVELWWLPLGAGGWFVASNGRLYERVLSWRERRLPDDIYHTALVVQLEDARTVIESAWPIPDDRGRERGVVLEGAVFAPGLGRWRVLRYEVRRWPGGVIADAAWAVDSPQLLSTDAARARKILALVPSVPRLTWGRDEERTGEMWNSNSVIAWLLARSGLRMEHIRPPPGGRAPGWAAGVSLATGPTGNRPGRAAILEPSRAA